MQESTVHLWTFRWKRVALILAVIVPILLLIRLLTMPIIMCIETYPDGQQVTLYGDECVRPIIETSIPTIEPDGNSLISSTVIPDSVATAL